MIFCAKNALSGTENIVTASQDLKLETPEDIFPRISNFNSSGGEALAKVATRFSKKFLRRKLCSQRIAINSSGPDPPRGNCSLVL
jgi:hypothetical protein